MYFHICIYVHVYAHFHKLMKKMVIQLISDSLVNIIYDNMPRSCNNIFDITSCINNV